MIPRKKIRVLFYAVSIFCFFGNEARAVADGIESTTGRYLEPNDTLEFNNTISRDVDSSTATVHAYTASSTSVDHSNDTEGVRNISRIYLDVVSEQTDSELYGSRTDFFSCIDMPSRVQNLTVFSTSNSLNVTWDSVTASDECILSYTITWYMENVEIGSLSLNPTESSFIISELRSCTSFTVEVIAVGQNGTSDAATVSSMTAESQISKVNLDVVGIEYGLNVTWNPPEDVSCLKSYLINVMTENDVIPCTETLPSLVTSFTCNNLEACTTYIVEVTPISIGDNYGTVATANGKTLASAGAVADGIECTTGRYLEPNDTLEFNNTISPDVDSSTATVHAYTASSTSVDHSNDTEGVRNISRIYLDVVSEQTESELYGSTTEFFSCIDTPSRVQNLTVFSTSNSLNVTWDSVTASDECILSYTITWYMENDEIGSLSLNPTESSFIISELRSCTSFTVKVVAVGQNGTSDAATVPSMTAESQISKVNLDVVGIEYGLNVTWNPPEDVSCLKSYLINVMTENDVIPCTETLPSLVTSFTCNNLEACTTYIVEVTPISIGDNYGTVATANGKTLASAGAVADGIECTTGRYLEPNDTLEFNNTISPDVDSSTATVHAYTASSTSVDHSNDTEGVRNISRIYLDVVSEQTESELYGSTTEFFSCIDMPSRVQNLTVFSTSNSLNVTWDSVTASDECILSYTITWYMENVEIGSLSLNPTESSFIISELRSCTSFTVEVIAVGQNGTSDAATVSSMTAESQISKVNLDVVGIEYGLNVTWNPPEDVSCLKSYLINVMTENDVIPCTETLPSLVTSYTCHNLEACTTYIVEVTPISIGDNYGTVATANGETLASVPGAVGGLTAPEENITKDSVYLTWLEPTVNPTCIMRYDIIICEEDNCVTKQTNDKFYTATNLSSCLNYTFNVMAVGKVGSSNPTRVTAETLYAAPGNLDQIAVTPGQFSLYISWEPPAIGGTCVSLYRVTLYETTVLERTRDTNITISNLIACKLYTIQINPVSATGGEGGLGIVEATTEASVHEPPLSVIDQTAATKSTITLGWSIDRTSNECELKTLLTTCNFTTTEGNGIIMVNGKSEDDLSTFGSSTDVTINVTVSNLSAFSSYECFGVIENIAGLSEPSNPVIVTTSEDVPSAPKITFSDLTSSAFTLSWAKPGYLAGFLIEHEIVLSWERQYLIPSSCVYNDSSETITGIAGTALEYFYSNATAYSNYTAQIRARTNAGWGDSDYISFRTNASVPGVVNNVEYSITPNSQQPTLLDTFLSWELPCALNGQIESFYIYFNGIRDGLENHTFTQVYNGIGNIHADHRFVMNLGELKAEYYYTFEISAKVVGVSERGPSTSDNVNYPAGIPPWPEESYIKKLRIDPHKAQRSSSTALVLLPLFDDTNGHIQYYAIMISQIDQSFPMKSRMDIQSGDWPNTVSWKEAMSHTPVMTYQATAIRWNPATTGHVREFQDFKAVEFMLGNDDTCAESPPGSFCNGPLKPDTSYQVRMRAFTNGGYRDSLAFIAKTKAKFNLGLVIGVVFGILFFGIILTMTFFIRKGVLQTVRNNFLLHSAQSSPGPDPFSRKKFELHCQEFIENPGKLRNEFQLLQTLSVDLEMSANAANMQANRKKNRYINILPYDISRVKLEVLNNDPNTDYINASFIPGYSGVVEYIASQGPKEETTYDFWRMVFQHNVKIIVMVTQLVEKNKDKCYQYYPNTQETFEYEDITIRCSTQLDFVFYTERIITLQKGNIRVSVTHLHFKEWSDHGVPDDVHSMINFCQIVRKKMNDHKSLAVVHCSAGVGRTGTLIAVDILLQQIKDNKKLDVFGTVYKLRQHRMNMVQTESQYAYIYNCTKQALNNPYASKPYKSPSSEPIYENLTMNKREITDSNTNLVDSAETLKKISPSPSINSMEPICEIVVPQRPIFATQLSTLSQAGDSLEENNAIGNHLLLDLAAGLRYSKSASALHTHIPPAIELVRYGSHEYPIFEPAPDSPSSRCSKDRNSLLEFARPIRIESTESRRRSPSFDTNTNYYILN